MGRQRQKTHELLTRPLRPNVDCKLGSVSDGAVLRISEWKMQGPELRHG